MNPFQRLLLGSGLLPEALRAELAADSDLLLVEVGLTGSITYRNYRAPGRYSNWKKQATSGAIAITARRLVVWTGGSKHIDVPLTSPARTAIEVAVEPPDGVCFAYDAGRFDQSRSGRVEVRLGTPYAWRVAELLSAARQTYPPLSPDRRYWWDGSNWRDTAVSVPDGAPRSADGAQWFDGVGWRPVPPGPAAQPPRTT